MRTGEEVQEAKNFKVGPFGSTFRRDCEQLP